MQRGLKGFYSGNSGVQAAGWFKKPIDSLADLSGLNMRIAAVAAALGLIALIATVIIKWRPESGGLVTITVNNHELVQKIDISKDSATIIDPNDNQEGPENT